MNRKLERFNYGLKYDTFNGIYSMFKKVYLTEKSSNLQQSLNTISFVTDNWMNKTSIKMAINTISPGNVIHVNIINMKGRCRQSRNQRGKFIKRVMGETIRSTRKKVFVKLKSVKDFMGALNVIRD